MTQEPRLDRLPVFARAIDSNRQAVESRECKLLPTPFLSSLHRERKNDTRADCDPSVGRLFFLEAGGHHRCASRPSSPAAPSASTRAPAKNRTGDTGQGWGLGVPKATKLPFALICTTKTHTFSLQHDTGDVLLGLKFPLGHDVSQRHNL
jgi:hypothetical protein